MTLPGGLRCTAESMATMRPVWFPPRQYMMLCGFPRQPSASQGRRSGLPSSMSSRNSLQIQSFKKCLFQGLSALLYCFTEVDLCGSL